MGQLRVKPALGGGFQKLSPLSPCREAGFKRSTITTHTLHCYYPYTPTLWGDPTSINPLHPLYFIPLKKLVDLPQEELGALSVCEFLLLISRDWLHTVQSLTPAPLAGASAFWRSSVCPSYV
jgi:hypothetical protein